MNALKSKLLVLAVLAVALASCKRLPPHKVTASGDDFAEVELETRIAVDDLYDIADEVRPPGKGTLNVYFKVPSQYPGAKSSWAQVTFLRLGETGEQVSLSVFGACTDLHRDSLLGVSSGPGYTPLGKWHDLEPAQEAVYLIKQKDTAFVLQRHLAGKYLESDREPLFVCGVWSNQRGVTEMKDPAFEKTYAMELPLLRKDAQTYSLADGSAVYRILPDGNLSLSDSLGHETGKAVKVP